MAKISFNQGELIRAADVNANFTEIYNGTGLDANAITNAGVVYAADAGSYTISSAAGMTAITEAAGSFISTGGKLLVFLHNSAYQDTASGSWHFRLSIDSGASYWPNGTGYHFYCNEINSHKHFSASGIISGLAAGSHTFGLQLQTSANNLKLNGDDQFILTVIELKK